MTLLKKEKLDKVQPHFNVELIASISISASILSSGIITQTIERKARYDNGKSKN
jgi:hypothetical protein